MKLALFLHAYQPPTQYSQITIEIAKRSYVPIVKALESSTRGKITLNMSGSLIEQLLENGESQLLDRYKTQVENGSIEYVGTAAYHPLLTKLPKTEIIRQNSINEYWLKKWLGDQYVKPNGFFIPEMVYDSAVGEIISDLGYKWVILDESAYPGIRAHESGQHASYSIGSFQYNIVNTNTHVFFRDRPLSLAIAFEKDLSIKSFIERVQEHEDVFGEQYAVVALDAETFGYHHKGNIRLLSGLFNQNTIELVTVSEIYHTDIEIKEIVPECSTWGVTIEDPNQERTFPRWNNPENEIHKLQWELFKEALEKGNHRSQLPDDLDKAFHSDQFWWASKSPCWHKGMVFRALEYYSQIENIDSGLVNKITTLLDNEAETVIEC
ncbi:hypothetical protein GW793_02215 [bacterium]|uniref:Glycoside hydrolase family 57 N-terminal domain-containing protein n=2 Tax=Katanobacteria TaxID=422282 RepID=A0A2M7X413_UNCKA|nr:hypothetical protein [bacterium]PIP56999.1 MAG: hypothetical protein COX05_00120 [candidate division WWE3 bacterium CG22_combo_CG10-13_8_21_14_all_39_12]PJA40887.1 MAG: hypothetical protein CO179_01145 [candidate division WWE3 bacterium CG_4_9_14_3_um_filter_39_7]